MTDKAVTIFSPEKMQAMVEALPPDIKPGDKVVMATLDDRGAQVLVRARFDNGLEIQAAARREHNGDIGAGASLVYRW